MGTQKDDGVRMRVIGNPDNWTKVFGSYATRTFFKNIKKNYDWEPLESWTRGIFCGMSMYDVADKMTEYNNEIDSKFSPLEYNKYILTMDGSSHDAH